MTMPETAQKAGNAEGLTGRIAEYQELLDVLDQRPGLTVISGDPWSGTSALLATVIDELHGTRVLVDARSCADSRDLAMATSRHGHRPARPRRGRMVDSDSATLKRRRPATPQLSPTPALLEGLANVELDLSAWRLETGSD
jgi:hypothetical protein